MKKDNADRVASIAKVEQRLAVKKSMLLEKALSSNDPNELIKATNIYNAIAQKQDTSRKSYVLDPFEFQSSFGFKDRRLSMSYNMLKAMARTPVINAIIRTRINQVAAFCEAQKDEYSIGYKIRKKQLPGMDRNSKLSKQEEAEIYDIQNFLENCGVSDKWGGDDFDSFTRKMIRDSLTFDQMTFEIIRDRRGRPAEYYAVDASTIRAADNYEDRDYEEKKGIQRPDKINGYYPSHVQIYNQRVEQEFYPWELCFGVRNPTSSIYSYGYGVSELEEMVSLVTSLLWGEEYNRNFFKKGTAPKGILKVTGAMNDSKLAEFRQQWNATMRGVSNAWKTPILEADKMDWIDLQRTNRDMEFSNWIEFLIKVGCSIYNIDPAEINFPLQGGANSSAMFEGNNEARLKHSKDKGLYPLLKFYQKKINKYLINPFNNKYEIVFVGMDAMTAKEHLDNDAQAVKTFKTVNEVRAERGMKPLEGGDILLDSIYAQGLQQTQMNQDAGMGVGQAGAEEATPDFLSEEGGGDDESGDKATANPFEKALEGYLGTLRLS